MAILTVLALHLFGIGAPAPLKSCVWQTLCSHGGFGVVLFFTVSGFLITYATAKRESNVFRLSPGRFYTCRASRVLPLLALVVALGALIRAYPPLGYDTPFHACFWNPAKGYNRRFWTSIALFGFNWTTLNGPFGLHWDVLWTLSIEEQFYCLFPLIVLAAGRRPMLMRLLALVVGAGPVARYFRYAGHPTNLVAGIADSIGHYDQIAMGVLLFCCWEMYGERLKQHKLLHSLMCIGGATLVAITYYCASPLNPLQNIYAPSLISLGVGLFCMGALASSYFQRIPKLLLVPGRLCYGLYLYQGIAMYFSWRFIFHQQYLVAFAGFVGLNLLISAISFKFYENPANRFIRRLFGERRAGLPSHPIPVVAPRQLVAAGDG